VQIRSKIYSNGKHRAPTALKEDRMISMTGFAARRGAGLGYAWVWDLRSVNGKGLDLRLRVPDWIDGLEAAVRADLQKAGCPRQRQSDAESQRRTRGAMTRHSG
jgi:hypothetical protein